MSPHTDTDDCTVDPPLRRGDTKEETHSPRSGVTAQLLAPELSGQDEWTGRVREEEEEQE